MKIPPMFISALGIVIAVPLIYFRYTPFALPSANVNVGLSCTGELDMETRSSSRWEDGQLTASVSEAQTCGQSQQSLAVQRLGSALFIRTKYASDTGVVAACICRQNYRVTVSEVPKQNYRVLVYNFP